ncbi:hypothetical protein ACIBSW_39610 [Actinoplanes sp. NPDC049668]|uniref:hypothetical protein n=1 Tax=unclassified Actinoplanes TaxID=2626549 RepID=UPI0033AB4A91
MSGGISLQSLEARMLSAELRGDEQGRRELDALDPSDESGWAEVMPVAVAMAAQRRFGPHDLRLITVFVRRFLARDPHGVFSAADVEAVLRGVLGEELLFNSVDRATCGEIMYALLFALVDELELSDEQADGLLVAAERRVAAEYRGVEVPPEGPPDAPVITRGTRRRTRRPYLGGDVSMPAAPETPKPARGALGRVFGGRKSRPARPGRGARNTSPSTLAGRFFSAAMLRHSEERIRLSAILHESGSDDVTRLGRVVFAVAVHIQFRPDSHLREISDLIAAAHGYYSDLDLMATEYMVRAALGEDVPEPDLTVDDEMLIRMLVLGTLADLWKRDEPAVNAMIVQAEANLVEAGGSLAPAGS